MVNQLMDIIAFSIKDLFKFTSKETKPLNIELIKHTNITKI